MTWRAGRRYHPTPLNASAAQNPSYKVAQWDMNNIIKLTMGREKIVMKIQ